MKKEIFRNIFKPLYKNILGADKTGNPPLYDNLLSWTFNLPFNSDGLSANDKTNNDFDAKFVESFCVSLPGNFLNEINYGNNYSVGTNSHTISAWIKPRTFTLSQGVISKRKGAVSEYCLYVHNGVLGVYDGNNVYNSTAPISLNTWQQVAYTYDYGTKKIRFFLNGSFVDELTLVQGFATTSPFFMRIGSADTGGYTFDGCISSVRIMTSKLSDADIATLYTNPYQTFASDLGNFVFQGSTFDLVRKVAATSVTNATFVQDNDILHYNLLNGFDKYSKDGSSPVEYLYVPYVGGVPIVTSVTGYTKVSSHPAGRWHNGAETKIMIGAGAFDGTGYPCNATIKAADAKAILHTAATGYCKSVDLNTFAQDFDEDYLFLNKLDPLKKKDLLLYDIAPDYGDLVAIINYIKDTSDFMIFEDYFFDTNGNVITYT